MRLLKFEEKASKLELHCFQSYSEAIIYERGGEAFCILMGLFTRVGKLLVK